MSEVLDGKSISKDLHMNGVLSNNKNGRLNILMIRKKILKYWNQ